MPEPPFLKPVYYEVQTGGRGGGGGRERDLVAGNFPGDFTARGPTAGVPSFRNSRETQLGKIIAGLSTVRVKSVYVFFPFRTDEWTVLAAGCHGSSWNWALCC